MCPNRFLPLDGLVNVYDEMDLPEKAELLARKIINKPAKIPSFTVSQIKEKMKKRLINNEIEKELPMD